jgi:5-methylcytosine-specific restriction endonuclease McrA
MKAGPMKENNTKLSTKLSTKQKKTQSRHERRKDDHSYRWSTFKSQARRRGIPFSITELEHFAIALQQCSYCGGKESTSMFNGIDRVDSNSDYSLQNLVPCCKICNVMKGSMGKQQFLEHVNAIHLHKARKGT